MIDQTKLDMLISLLGRGRITLEDIKDPAYREAAAHIVDAEDGGQGGA